MKSCFPSLLLALLAASPSAHAQYVSAVPVTRHPGLTPAAAGGAFLAGADDCSSPHTPAGTGTVTGVPFVTGTTGTTGQSEAPCYAFGSSSIDGDVWFDWTASASGNATFSTCGGTTVDTKIAAWPDNSPASCPPNGSSLACNDDSCGLQSSVTWAVTAGATYTLQLGTFPGASGGSGSFDVVQSTPPPCGQLDDGVAENALGLTAGGEIGWINGFDCLTSFDAVLTHYGAASFPSIPDGTPSRVAVYDDTDTTPANGATLIDQVDTVVVNSGTGLFNVVPLTQAHTKDPTLPTHVRTFVLASADQVAGEFPAPMDMTNPSPEAWVVGSTLGPGTLDLVDLTNNNVPPLNMTSIGFPAVWLLRITDTTTGVETGTRFCFGDGSGAPCGCGNEDLANPGTGGCLNGLGVGAVLTSSGLADTTNDTLVLTASGVPAQPGLFFQGDMEIAAGAGVTFGDGIRCCGGTVLRLEIVVGQPPQPTSVSSSVTISAHPGQSSLPGSTRCYQFWYRNPGSSPCGTNFNLTNALRVLWV